MPNGNVAENDYAKAWDLLIRAVESASGVPSATLDNTAGLNVDHQLKIAEIAALLSIAQELSALKQRGNL